MKWKDVCYCHKFWSDSYHCGGGGGGGGGGGNREKDTCQSQLSCDRWYLFLCYYNLCHEFVPLFEVWGVDAKFHTCLTSNFCITLAGCDVFTVMLMKNPVSWGVTPCCCVNSYQYFSATVRFDVLITVDWLSQHSISHNWDLLYFYCFSFFIRFAYNFF